MFVCLCFYRDCLLCRILHLFTQGLLCFELCPRSPSHTANAAQPRFVFPPLTEPRFFPYQVCFVTRSFSLANAHTFTCSHLRLDDTAHDSSISEHPFGHCCADRFARRRALRCHLTFWTDPRSHTRRCNLSLHTQSRHSHQPVRTLSASLGEPRHLH